MIHENLLQANDDMERYQFNTVVSAAMKILNLLVKLTTKNEAESHLIHEGLGILLRLLSPITPHIAHFLWKSLGFGENILYSSWPKTDSKALALQNSQIEMVVQINGKLRARIQISSDASEKLIENTALNQDNVQRYVSAKKVKKVIIIPKKLINIVI